MDVLVAIVDVHAQQWGRRAASSQRADGAGQPPSLTFTAFADQLIVFFNAFLILNKANQLCVIGMDGAHADFIWPPHMVHRMTTDNATEDDASMETDDGPAGKGKRKTKAQQAQGSAAGTAAAASSATVSAPAPPADHDSGSIGVDDELIKQLHAFAARNPHTPSDGADAADQESSKLAGALSLGLCYLNRVHNLAAASPSSAKLRSRMLIFSLCPDQSSSYVSMMNGIFSTQKQAIPVDSCVLAETDSLFLQQASHLTKGVYGRVPMHNQHALLQYLMFMYLSDPTSRQHLILPSQTQVDFRATCFCHQQVVNMGVVCPVCLAIYCRSTPTCPVCATRFALIGNLPQQRPNTPGLTRPATPAAAPQR